MNRRELSRISIIGLTCIALPAFPMTGTELSDLVSDREAAAAVGAAFIRQRPELASRSRLLAHLGLPEDLTNRERVAAVIERRIKRDFESQRVLVLNGWLVSESEAAICGLMALG